MSEPLSILLHAAARGARFEKNYSLMGWRKIHWSDLCEDPRIRIRRKDKHLRYGPISRVLFEAAKEPPEYLESIKEWYAREYAREFRGNDMYNMGMNKSQRSFFLLFVAEALAHEGL